MKDMAALESIAAAYAKVAPNWYETKIKARDQEKLLRQITRLIQHAIETLDNDLHTTRVKSAREYLEDAYNELKDDYGMEGE